MKTLQEFLSLRNGPDVRGVAIDGVENEPVTLDSETVKQIAKAFAVWLKEKLQKENLTVSVGYDSRLSSPDLSAAVLGGLTEMGVDAISTGLSTTPSMFMLLKDEQRTEKYPCDGSVMITASHLPYHRNGLKFFTPVGGLDGNDVKEILTLAAEVIPTANTKGQIRFAPYLADYAKNLVQLVRNATGEEQPLQGKKILVDAGNGASGFFATDVLVPLGADVSGSQFLEPDGNFPNHIPNPENAEAMRSICDAVQRENADFGIIFDTDGDRAGAVEKGGAELNRNRLIALISAILLEEQPGTIVTDSVTSDGLAQFIAAKGGRHHRFKRGYRNVIDEAVRLNESGEYTPLAIETSGHAALKENYFLDDGAYLVTRLLIALAKASKQGRELTDLIADMPLPKEAKEVRVKFKPDVDFKTLGMQIIVDYKFHAQDEDGLLAAAENYEGFRVNYLGERGDGWALLRMSLHEPILPINAESNSVGGTRIILRDVYDFLKKYDGLDLSVFEGNVAEDGETFVVETPEPVAEETLEEAEPMADEPIETAESTAEETEPATEETADETNALTDETEPMTEETEPAAEENNPETESDDESVEPIEIKNENNKTGDMQMNVKKTTINAIRVLSAEAIEKAKSGHPGLPLGCAPIAYTLFQNFLKFNPRNAAWDNRDRFVLSAGHGSAMYYSLLHLYGYGLEMDDLMNFRQLGSKTPGHPEFGHTYGIETTTGPLGQGIANAVGMAMAEANLAARFNRPGFDVVDHYTYVLCGDGCLEEGISYEACSFAGTHKLGKLILLYDDNDITIEGDTDVTFKEHVGARFAAQNWQVLHVDLATKVDDIDALSAAIEKAKARTDKPSIIICKTHIGQYSPLQDSEKSHGAPLGQANLEKTKAKLGWDYPPFECPQEVYDHCAQAGDVGETMENAWNDTFAAYEAEYPELAEAYKKMMAGEMPNFDEIEGLYEFEKPMATRQTSAKILNAIAKEIPMLIGGSADLGPSNLSEMKNTEEVTYGTFTPNSFEGRNVHFGIREHAMAAIANGLQLHGGMQAYCATFFVFSDYCKPAMRLAALMKLPVTYIMTHDSIGVGEDGPTHQPVEQLIMLRSIPGLKVFRPADGKETAAAWISAMSGNEPTALVLTRQALPQYENSGKQALMGGYVLEDCDGEPDVLLIATGSEVELCVKAKAALAEEGLNARVVSMPCIEEFEKQSDEYKQSVLPSNMRARVCVEAGSPYSWYKYAGDNGEIVAMNSFGASAPAGLLFPHFGFSVENVVASAKASLGKVNPEALERSAQFVAEKAAEEAAAMEALAEESVEETLEQPVEEPIEESVATEEMTEPMEEVVEKTAESVEEAVEETAESVEEAVEETAETVDEVVEETAESVEEVVEETAESVEEAVEETAESVEEVVEESNETTEE